MTRCAPSDLTRFHPGDQDRPGSVLWRLFAHQKYLIGVQLGASRSADARRSYQAGSFAEFCAESFMHLAAGHLAEHLKRIKQDAEAPPEVRMAWQVAGTVLERYRAALGV